MAGAAASASAAPSDAAEDRAFLALGDSVAFGYITQDGYAYINPDNFIGYPSYAGLKLRLDAANAGCPGETTGSFISLTMPDNGCQGFRARFRLHVPYGSTQLDFATRFLATHDDTRLVTIGLGANDLFLLEDACAGDLGCIQIRLPAVLATIRSNMDTILEDLRATGFTGVLMVVNYYSLDYTDPFQTGVIELLNQAVTASATAHRAAVADAFTAFQTAASTSFAGGKTCKTGLLNASPQDQSLCDIHPSQSGQQLLAVTVEAAYRAALHAHGRD
jgi:lysophospholipase L1-like esterase